MAVDRLDAVEKGLADLATQAAEVKGGGGWGWKSPLFWVTLLAGASANAVMALLGRDGVVALVKAVLGLGQ